MLQKIKDRYIVLGSTGAIGSEIVNYCKKKNYDYIGLSKSAPPQKKNLKVNFIKKNIKNVLSIKESDTVFILYGITDQKILDKNKKLAYKTNYQSIVKNINSLKKTNPLIVFFSSSAVFGKDNKKVYSEISKPCPESYYGKLKLKVEKYIVKNYKNYLIVRSGWISSKMNNCIIKQTLNNLKKNKCFIIKNSYVNLSDTGDITKNLFKLIQYKKRGIFHLVNSKISREKISQIIKKNIKENTNYKIIDKKKLKIKKNINFILKSIYNNKLNFIYKKPEIIIKNKINYIN